MTEKIGGFIADKNCTKCKYYCNYFCYRYPKAIEVVHRDFLSESVHWCGEFKKRVKK